MKRFYAFLLLCVGLLYFTFSDSDILTGEDVTIKNSKETVLEWVDKLKDMSDKEEEKGMLVKEEEKEDTFSLKNQDFDTHQRQDSNTQQKQDSSHETATSTGSYIIPEYTGYKVVIINENIPYFTTKDLQGYGFENYTPLDYLGRVGVADALLTRDMMPTEKRGDISQVYPSGWNQFTYTNNNGKRAYLYNRSHLIGYQLTGQNDNPLNLMTGTRSFNHPEMSAFENAVSDYVKDTGNPVRYRVTPAFLGEELVARGVFMEALSEDGQVEFNVFIHNVEEGFTINYATGVAVSDWYAPITENTSPSTTQPNNSYNSNNSGGNVDDSGTGEDSATQNAPTNFKNCTELRKVYPNGVKEGHPAYSPKHDRDGDGYACEKK